VDEVVIGERTHGLVLHDAIRDDAGDLMFLRVDLAVDEMRAGLTACANYATGFTDLAGLFAAMAADWRGWSGERRYESVEHDLLLIGTHLGSRVKVDVELTSTRDLWWQVRTAFTVDAGEQLTTIADELAALVAPRG
jgi:Family of unknown function (DUF6228)